MRWHSFPGVDARAPTAGLLHTSSRSEPDRDTRSRRSPRFLPLHRERGAYVQSRLRSYSLGSITMQPHSFSRDEYARAHRPLRTPGHSLPIGVDATSLGCAVVSVRMAEGLGPTTYPETCYQQRGLPLPTTPNRHTGSPNHKRKRFHRSTDLRPQPRDERGRTDHSETIISLCAPIRDSSQQMSAILVAELRIGGRPAPHFPIARNPLSKRATRVVPHRVV